MFITCDPPISATHPSETCSKMIFSIKYGGKYCPPLRILYGLWSLPCDCMLLPEFNYLIWQITPTSPSYLGLFVLWYQDLSKFKVDRLCGQIQTIDIWTKMTILMKNFKRTRCSRGTMYEWLLGKFHTFEWTSPISLWTYVRPAEIMRVLFYFCIHQPINDCKSSLYDNSK